MGSTKGFANLQVCFAIALFGPLTYGLPPDPGAQGYSLQKALKTTFENNKKMNSNNFKIAAIRERSEAVKKGIWPAPVFSAGFGKNFGNQTMGGDVSSTNQLSDSRSLRIDFNLWRGGADRDAARAAEAHAQAQIEAYDSTTGQIPNTKGSLAGR